MRELNRRDAEVAITFAQATAKLRYDDRHRPVQFQVGDRVMLNLHRGYKLPGTSSHKFTQQRVGPFKILQRVGNLANRLQLLARWNIEPVISIAHLSPVPPEIVEMEGNTEEWKSYELERVLDNQFTRYHQKDDLEYLVKFKNMGAEHNDWYPYEPLDNARELVQDFENSLPRRRIELRNYSTAVSPELLITEYDSEAALDEASISSASLTEASSPRT
jgi:hypothetical protein